MMASVLRLFCRRRLLQHKRPLEAVPFKQFKSLCRSPASSRLLLGRCFTTLTPSPTDDDEKSHEYFDALISTLRHRDSSRVEDPSQPLPPLEGQEEPPPRRPGSVVEQGDLDVTDAKNWQPEVLHEALEDLGNVKDPDEFSEKQWALMNQITNELVAASVAPVVEKAPKADLRREQLKHLPRTVNGFFEMYEKHLSSYHLFFQVCADHGSFEEAAKAMQTMKKEGIWPDSLCYKNMIMACANGGTMEDANAIFQEMVEEEIHLSESHFGVLIETAVRLGDMDEALKIVSELKERRETPRIEPNLIMYTSLLKGCAKIKPYRLDLAWELFEMMEKHFKLDSAVYSIMLSLCHLTQDAEKALHLWSQMQAGGVLPTRRTYTSLIHAMVGRADYYDTAFEYYRQMLDIGFVPDETLLGSLIDLCADQGDLANAENVLRQADLYKVERTADMYRGMMKCVMMATKRGSVKLKNGVVLRKKDLVKLAKSLLARMKEVFGEVREMEITMVIGTMVEAGHFVEAKRYLYSLYREHGLTPEGHAFKTMSYMYLLMKNPRNAVMWMDRMELTEPADKPLHLAILRQFALDIELYHEDALKMLKRTEGNGFEVGRHLREAVLNPNPNQTRAERGMQIREYYNIYQ